MNKKVGQVSFYGLQQDQWNKPYSDDTATLIDTEVRKLLDEQYARSQKLLKSKKNELDILAKALLEKEVLIKSDVEKLIGPRPFEDPTDYHLEDDSVAENGSAAKEEITEEAA